MSKGFGRSGLVQLNEIAAGVVENRHHHRPRGCRRTRERHSQRDESLMLFFQVVDRESGGR
jgi:hypothetical protein